MHFYAEKNNKELETAREIGGAVGTVAVMGWNVAKYSSAEKLEFKCPCNLHERKTGE